MEIIVKTIENVKIIALNGKLDSSTTPEVQRKVLPMVEPGCRILLDMQDVSFMSSAGLRMLLLLNRKIADMEGHVILIGVSQRLQDVMSMTGFLRFFTYYDTVNDGLAAMNI